MQLSNRNTENNTLKNLSIDYLFLKYIITLMSHLFFVNHFIKEEEKGNFLCSFSEHNGDRY